MNYTRAKTASFVYGPVEPITARLYRDKKCVSFTLTDLRYMMTMLHTVQAQQSQYIIAQSDVMAFALAALGPIEFLEPPRTTAGLIPYCQLFEELKMRLV